MPEKAGPNPLVKLVLWGLVLAAGAAYAHQQGWINWPDGPAPVPDGPRPDVPAPRPELQQRVAPITAALEDQPQKAAALAAFYRDFAAVIERDAEGQIVSAVGVFRTAHNRALRLLVQQTPSAGGDIGALIDGALEPAIGKAPSTKLAGELRQKLIETLRAVSWACGQAAGGGGG